MLQTVPLGGRSAMLQIFRGKVCNVADLPGGRSAMLQTFRGKVCKGEGLQYNTDTPPRLVAFYDHAGEMEHFRLNPRALTGESDMVK